MNRATAERTRGRRSAVPELTTVWVRSMSAITVFFRYPSLDAASVKRNISELVGALAKASLGDRRTAAEFDLHALSSGGDRPT